MCGDMQTLVQEQRTSMLQDLAKRYGVPEAQQEKFVKALEKTVEGPFWGGGPGGRGGAGMWWRSRGFGGGRGGGPGGGGRRWRRQLTRPRSPLLVGVKHTRDGGQVLEEIPHGAAGDLSSPARLRGFLHHVNSSSIASSRAIGKGGVAEMVHALHGAKGVERAANWARSRSRLVHFAGAFPFVRQSVVARERGEIGIQCAGPFF